MKWGIRRFQNNDGSLTALGKQRYKVDLEGQRNKVSFAKKEFRDARNEYLKNSFSVKTKTGEKRKAKREYRKALEKFEYQKDRLSSEKIKNKLNLEKGSKSKRRLKFEEEYRRKGMSEEEAEIAAYKRVRTEKIIAATAGVTIAAATAYVAYKHYDKTIDRIIKSGTELQNISGRSDKGIRDAFYFSMRKSDNIKYRGIYGHQLLDRRGQVFEQKIGVNKALKVASQRSAKNALADLVNSNPEYKKLLGEYLDQVEKGRHNFKQKAVVQKGLESFRKGKIDENVYNALNFSLPMHGLKNADAVHKGFYDKLKSLGYDAIDDLNDRKWSGFNASRPMIAFNASGKAAVKNVLELDYETIRKATDQDMNREIVKQLLPVMGGYVLGGVGVGGSVRAISSSNRRKQRAQVVQNYKKEHPGTKLSDTQILDRYYG